MFIHVCTCYAASRTGFVCVCYVWTLDLPRRCELCLQFSCCASSFFCCRCWLVVCGMCCSSVVDSLLGPSVGVVSWPLSPHPASCTPSPPVCVYLYVTSMFGCTLVFGLFPSTHVSMPWLRPLLSCQNVNNDKVACTSDEDGMVRALLNVVGDRTDSRFAHTTGRTWQTQHHNSQ